MITIKKISVNELPILVKIAYDGDNDLFNKYVGNNSEYMTCVNGELMNIYELAKDKRLKYYKVCYQKKPIGYFVTFENCLYSFAININYRKKDILLAWWDKVKKTMNTGFGCYLYKKNERAINFLKRNRMKVVEENDEYDSVFLINY